MAQHTQKASPGMDDASSSTTDAAHMTVDAFATRDVFVSQSLALSEALLRLQRDAADYLELNRRWLDTVRHIVRAQQDLALELSASVLAAVAKPRTPAGGLLFDPGAVSAAPDRPVTEATAQPREGAPAGSRKVEKAPGTRVPVAEAA